MGRWCSSQGRWIFQVQGVQQFLLERMERRVVKPTPLVLAVAAAIPHALIVVGASGAGRFNTRFVDQRTFVTRLFICRRGMQSRSRFVKHEFEGTDVYA